eukprot:CAMPEP_0117551410 /NCGR_PEP_ID=MMETSP0784-20121206/49178_1 /TAXON_ID=39447 /ORGANISM="" /LENGTH=145 /DNA_ID=CAMNT_0005348451 /DNA_START=67 /DNA_END=504 /DNA_ORIENTATION=+
MATIDSLSLLFAMSALLGCSVKQLKDIADLEHDLMNTSDFTKDMSRFTWLENAFMLFNVVCLLPFLGSWWMVPPQLFWVACKSFRFLKGGTSINEKEILRAEVYQKHRNWHVAGLFLYLISWFIYFARAITAVMDIHVHGISPYD